MPRKTNSATDKFFDPLPTALRDLLDNRGITQDALAKELGISRQAVSLYCLGTSAPTLPTLKAIAEYFRVSADYLLGLSGIQSPSCDIITTAATTGLTEEAIRAIQELEKTSFTTSSLDKDISAPDKNGAAVLSELLTSTGFKSVVEYAAKLYLKSAFTDAITEGNEVLAAAYNMNYAKDESEINAKYAGAAMLVCGDDLNIVYIEQAKKYLGEALEDMIRRAKTPERKQPADRSPECFVKDRSPRFIPSCPPFEDNGSEIEELTHDSEEG